MHCLDCSSFNNQCLSGFTHSAFALGYEAGINKSTIDGNLVPPGALVTFVQKGIQYVELEANLSCVSTFIYSLHSFTLVSCTFESFN